MKFILVLTAILAIGQCQIIIPGQCKDENVVKDFDIKKYSGVWYETHRYEQAFEKDAECVTAEYTLQDDGVRVFNSRVANGSTWSLMGSAKPAADAEGAAKLLVQFPSIGDKISNYWVLSTDYTGHSLVYSCRDGGNGNIRVSSWILSRKPELTIEAKKALQPAIDAATGLSWQNYRETSHSDDACKVTTPLAGEIVV